MSEGLQAEPMEAKIEAGVGVTCDIVAFIVVARGA